MQRVERQGQILLLDSNLIQQCFEHVHLGDCPFSLEVVAESDDSDGDSDDDDDG